jgi:hypothetical protein
MLPMAMASAIGEKLMLLCALSTSSAWTAWQDARRQQVSDFNRTHLVLFGMQNRTLGSCLAASNRIPILVLAVHAIATTGSLVEQ